MAPRKSQQLPSFATSVLHTVVSFSVACYDDCLGNVWRCYGNFAASADHCQHLFSNFQSPVSSLIAAELLNATLSGIPRYLLHAAATVGDALGCTAASPRRSATAPTSLAERPGADRVQTRCPRVLMSARTAALYFADELHRLADSEARRPLRGASSTSLIVTGGSIAMKAGGATLPNPHSRLVYSSLTGFPVATANHPT